jgi:Transcriptional regulator, AbiEi antitoxin
LGHLGRIAHQIPQRPEVAIARRQHRIITRAQLLALGLSPDTIKRLVRAGWLHREHLGVYAVGTPATTPLERAAAAVLACGDGAALSHASALALWGWAKRWPNAVHVTTQSDRRPSGLIVHRSTKLERADIRTHLGIRTTSPARSLLDCAPTIPITRPVNDALRSRFLTQAQLADVCARNPKHPGTKLLIEFLDLTSGPTRSEFEDAFPGFCQAFGLPVPRMNVIVCGYEVDAYFPDHGVIVELDGWAFHRDRVTFESDRNRDADTLAAGLVTVRITWARMTTDPQHEADRLNGILEQRLASGAWPPSGG